jgi:hypothetical protein
MINLPCIWPVECWEELQISSSRAAYQSMRHSCMHCHCPAAPLPQRVCHPPLQMQSCQQCAVHWAEVGVQTIDLIVGHTHATRWLLPDPNKSIRAGLLRRYSISLRCFTPLQSTQCLILSVHTSAVWSRGNSVGRSDYRKKYAGRGTWVHKKSHSSVKESSCRMSYKTRPCKSRRQLRQTALRTACWARGTRAKHRSASSSGSAGIRPRHGSSFPLRLLKPISGVIVDRDCTSWEIQN